MASEDDLPKIGKNNLKHKKSLTEHTLEQMLSNPTAITKTYSHQNSDSNPKKKFKNGKIKKRNSEAALYINTSKLFPIQTRNNHTNLNGHKTHKTHRNKKALRHSAHIIPPNHGQRKLKRRIYYQDDDKYAAFDFNGHKQHHQNEDKQKKSVVSRAQPTRRRAITVNPPHTKQQQHISFTPPMDSHNHKSYRNSANKNINSAPILSRPKSVKFSHSNSNPNNRTKNSGISFRKSHNNLPIMHPDEAIQNMNKKKRANFSLYKQRASYTAAHFSRNKHQLLSQRKKHHHKISTVHESALHREDEEFVHSLIAPLKKKELNDAIIKLKEVIESENVKNLIGSTIQMTLREVLRKLQLLRLEVTLREYRQHNSSTSSPNNTDRDTTDDETIATIASKLIPQRSFDQRHQLHLDQISEEKEKEMCEKKAEKEEEKKKKEEEQNRILSEIETDKSSPTQDKDLVSALLFASSYHRNHYEVDEPKHSISKPKRRVTLTRRRYTLSGTKPTDSDRAGIEVAQWLSTRYSTFGRYEIPPSPIQSVPIKAFGSPDSIDIHNNYKNMKTLRLNHSDSQEVKEIHRKQIEKTKKLFEEKKRKLSLTRIDINHFLKCITSDQILIKLRGIGDDWDWSIFDLHDICGDSVLLITAHYIFEQLNLFEKFSISYSKFQSFFSVIQRGYKKNPYHSSLHGADVLINMYFWIKSDTEFRTFLSDLDIIIALISAACHDYMHPGLTQNFQISTNSDMALKYNGRSVLENMHCSETIRLLLRPEYGIFNSLKKSEFRYVRELITDMILGTDMQMHSDHVKKSNELCTLYEGDISIDKEKHTKHVLVVGLHIADIANPCKPWLDCKRWTYMLMEEWFRQGDKEKTMKLEVSPMMDRSKPNIPRGQVGFIDYIVKPIVINWNKLFEKTSICLQHLLLNRENWTKCTNDPNANDVQHNLSILSKKSGLKLIKLNEPITLDHPNHTPRADDEDESYLNEFNVKKKQRKKKKKKKKSKFNALRINSDPAKIDNKTNNKVQDVPFTPEQAEALHVTYNDIVTLSSDNDEKENNNNERIESSVD